MKLNSSYIYSRFNTDYIVGSKIIEVLGSEIQVLLVSIPLQSLGLSGSLSGRACDFCDIVKTTTSIHTKSDSK